LKNTGKLFSKKSAIVLAQEDNTLHRKKEKWSSTKNHSQFIGKIEARPPNRNTTISSPQH
jgi:hypothetical protein